MKRESPVFMSRSSFPQLQQDHRYTQFTATDYLSNPPTARYLMICADHASAQPYLDTICTHLIVTKTILATFTAKATLLHLRAQTSSATLTYFRAGTTLTPPNGIDACDIRPVLIYHVRRRRLRHFRHSLNSDHTDLQCLSYPPYPADVARVEVAS